MTQEQQVIEAIRRSGGYSTLRKLYGLVDSSKWKTLTPEATVRRIVQDSKHIFRIQPGLWALEEKRDEVLSLLNLQPGNKKSEEIFSHGYYQGLLVEIGKWQEMETYIPAQDKNRLFIGQKLGDMADTTILPSFTYTEITRRARTVDVIWFNHRRMPSAFYEVEHTTDIRNSLSKFFELQDFHARFFIVADLSRKREFEDKLHSPMFEPIHNRVTFLDYQRVAKMYECLTKMKDVSW